MLDEKNEVAVKKRSYFTGGPLGLGDPNDRKLRKAERDIVIPKLLLKEAEKKCSDLMQVFLNCAKEAGLLVSMKCKQENNAKNDCMSVWLNNPDFKNEITEKYLDSRSHYRSTGESLIKHVRFNKPESEKES